MKLPVPDKSYDAVYAIEATCHAPDKVKLFTELHRVMKDGAEFAGYEWCLTKKYDKNNPEHRAIKKGIEEGDALPDIWYEADVVDALKQAGFEVLDARDLAPTSDRETPWELALSQPFSLSLRHLQAHDGGARGDEPPGARARDAAHRAEGLDGGVGLLERGRRGARAGRQDRRLHADVLLPRP